MFTYSVIILTIGLYIIWKKLKYVKWCTSPKCLVGKTAIITGSNTGIGYQTALDLAKRGGRIILACRNQERANLARDKIIKATGNPNVVVKILNLESLSSVRKFAKEIIESEDRLDLLINNAGAGGLPHNITEDGLQNEMATNYLGHFLLTNLLLDLLKKSTPSRIVNVSSVTAIFVINFDLNTLNDDHCMLYCRTKLCQIYFTQELAKRLNGTDVTTYSLHPGAIHSEFGDFSTVFSWINSKCLKTAEEGAQTSLYTALEPGIEHLSGEHFDNCERIGPYTTARDPQKRLKLWEISEEMVRLSKK